MHMPMLFCTAHSDAEGCHPLNALCIMFWVICISILMILFIVARLDHLLSCKPA